MKQLYFLLCFFPSLNFGDEILLSSSGAVRELKSRVVDALPAFHGWCTKEKATNFIDLVLKTKPKVCVEIGVYGGSSFFPVLSALNFLGEGVAIGIDPWDRNECIKYLDPLEDKGTIAWWGTLNLDSICSSCLQMIANYALEKHCILIKLTSAEAVDQIDVIDILHLDGNFSELMSTIDVMLYLPKVRSGGYIWLNDALSLRKQRAMSLIEAECEMVKKINFGNCILFRKKYIHNE